jgi:ribose transport system substrate-binding protein
MRKSRLVLAPAVMLAAAALVLSGCAAAEEETTTDAGSTTDSTEEVAETYEVYALLPQGSDQPYGTYYVPAMEAAAAELGINLTITNSQYDGDKQASECEIAVAAKPDGIILWPAVGDSVRPCLEAAAAAGIPVTITNSDLFDADKDLSFGYSGPDTYGQGVSSAEIMCELVGDTPVNIIQLNGAAGNSTAIDRDNGFTDTIAANCPNVTILQEESTKDWSKANAQQNASEMITAQGLENIGGIYAADDTIAAGAIAALEARGVVAADYFITSIGNTFLGNPLVIDGSLDGTVFQSSSWDGENATRLMYEVLTGAIAAGEREVRFMPSVKVTAANASDANVAPEW